MATVRPATLKIPRFVAPDGKPTCALRWGILGETCYFLRTQKMGTVEVCQFTDEKLSRSGDDHLGHLQPCANCPLWTNPQWTVTVLTLDDSDQDKKVWGPFHTEAAKERMVSHLLAKPEVLAVEITNQWGLTEVRLPAKKESGHE